MCSLNSPSLQDGQLKPKPKGAAYSTPCSPQGQGHLELGRRHSEPGKILHVCALRRFESQLRRDIPTFRVFLAMRPTCPQGRYGLAGG